jgi:hypothetical protein
MSCAAAQTHLDALFVGELEPKGFEALREHVKGCADCLEQYERISRVESVLEHGGMAPERSALLEGRLLARIAAKEPPKAAWLAWRDWLMPFLGAAALVALIIPLSRGTDDGWQSRGAKPVSAFGVRAFCVEPGAAPRILSEARSGGTLVCPPGAAVQFTYTAPRPALLQISLEGSPLVFFPADGEPTVVSGLDVPIGHSTPVDAQWLAAPVRATARFNEPESGALISQTSIDLRPSRP